MAGACQLSFDGMSQGGTSLAESVNSPEPRSISVLGSQKHLVLVHGAGREGLESSRKRSEQKASGNRSREK